MWMENIWFVLTMKTAFQVPLGEGGGGGGGASSSI